ncbi:hypothetical protein HPP92_001540 [Vanilla planifolia]|uniref:Glucan endo-1,3-beta-D-glucosidase n=1 Tax=Vanilla planifolia TaxID=51239 RepID=A0A835SCX8_VANPL|nr:hypothetical protein HPP92_001540 [Vanilla planifolia]
MLGNNLPTPEDVISLYKARKIEAMRLYDANKDVLQALNGSNIHLLLDVPNELLQLFATDSNAANTWVQSKVAQYSPTVHFRYIAVGNEVIPGNLAQFVLPAMASVTVCTVSAGLHSKIKVWTSVSQAVLGASYPPSAGAFTSEADSFLGPIARFLEGHRAPLLVNLYPYFAYRAMPHESSHGLCIVHFSGGVVFDGKLNYSNLFDAMVDSVYSALEKIGGEMVEVVVWRPVARRLVVLQRASGMHRPITPT